MRNSWENYQATFGFNQLFFTFSFILAWFCLLPHTAYAQTCNTPSVTTTVSVNTWDSSSGWLSLTTDPALRASITAVSVTVLAGANSANKIHVLENWGSPIASKNLPGGTTIVSIPARSTPATLQFYIEHVGGAAFQASLMLCTNAIAPSPTPTPVPTPTPTPPPATGNIPIPTLQFQPLGDYSLPTAKKASLPAAASRSEDFANWANPTLSAECIDSHNRYWVSGPDQLAYHTWHPVTETISVNGAAKLCEYGHEHGSDPSKSPAFRFSGGWPPFGYVQQHQPTAGQDPSHRHEDHFGHKVNVATFNAALGKPQEAGTTLYDAGFSCHFISKLHQGTWSIDAFANHAHEYFITVVCNDKFQTDSSRATTWFSAKRMGVFGHPNTFKKICPSYTDQALAGMLDFNGVNINLTQAVLPINPSGNREFQCFNTDLQNKLAQENAQPELWTGQNSIQTGTGTAIFAPYYIVKNPARLYDGSHRAKKTIDYCYDGAGKLLNKRYCSQAPAVKPAWDSTGSPFKGTLRAVNFKEIQLYNRNGNTEVCTNTVGEFLHKATATTPCNYKAGEIYQAVSPTNNEWLALTRCNNGHCGEIHGSLENAIKDPQPGDPDRYKAPGIGFEHLETHDHPSIRGQN